MTAFTAELHLLLLLLTANGTPVIMTLLLGQRWAMPVDGHRRFIDRRPLLGPSKTWRGVAGAVVATTLVAPLLSLPLWFGAAVGALAGVGDLTSSFVKRRLGLRSSSMALGLDQVPESLLPAWFAKVVWDQSWLWVGALVLVFFVSELVLSRVAYHLHIRKQPF